MEAPKDTRPLNLQFPHDSADAQQRTGRAFEMETLWKVEQRMKELQGQLAVEASNGNEIFNPMERATSQWLTDLRDQDLDANAAYRTVSSLGHQTPVYELTQVASWFDGLESNIDMSLEDLHPTGDFAQMQGELAFETAHAFVETPSASRSLASSSARAHLSTGPDDTTYHVDTDRTNSGQFTPSSTSRRT